MTLLADLRDWKIDVSTRNVVYESPGVPQIIEGVEVVDQNISLDLIFNRKVSQLLADNPDSTENHLQSIAGWAEEDPFVINGTAKAELERVSLYKQNILITANVDGGEEPLELQFPVMQPDEPGAITGYKLRTPGGEFIITSDGFIITAKI